MSETIQEMSERVRQETAAMSDRIAKESAATSERISKEVAEISQRIAEESAATSARIARESAILSKRIADESAATSKRISAESAQVSKEIEAFMKAFRVKMDRAARWSKTLDYADKKDSDGVGRQDDDEKVRILRDVVLGDMDKTPDEEPALRFKVEAIIAETTRKVDNETKAALAAALREATAALATADGHTAANTEKVALGVLAKEVMHAKLAACGEAERIGGISTRMRLGLDCGGLSVKTTELETAYQALQPKLSSSARKVAPPADGDPVPDGMTMEAGRLFTTLKKSIEGKMSADPSVKPVVADLEAFVDGVIRSMTASRKEPADPAAEHLRCRHDWETVKTTFKEKKRVNPVTAREYMERMWWYRRRLVDQQMLALQKTYDFDWASVGSANLESDYDISVKSHGALPTPDGTKDYDVVTRFNAALSGLCGGKQPGTAFDTNLYASADISDRQKLLLARDTPMKAMKESGQDVGALMKMRRFMEWDEYESYKNGIIDGIADADAQTTAMLQFEEADSLYFMALRQQLQQAGIVGDRATQFDDTPKGQKKMIEMAKALEEDPDKLMKVNNELYLAAMVEVRALEDKAKAATSPERELEVLAVLKTKQADATFFAAEAYHSDGPFKHIVWADQAAAGKIAADDSILPGDKPAAILLEKATRLASISIPEMLQSFNENTGDLLKDLGHYAHKSPFAGLGFYRSSKYLGRVCLAMSVISDKLTRDEHLSPFKTTFDGIRINGHTPDEVKAVADALTKLRGGKEEITGVEDPQAETEAFSSQEMMTKLGIGSLDGLGMAVKKTGQDVNKLLREVKAFADKMSVKAR